MKIVLSVIGIVIVFFGIVFGTSFFGLQMTKFFAPAYEDVRRNTFEHSRAYNEGTIRQLERLQLDYANGNDEQKAAIKDIARHDLADVNLDDLPPSLRIFARSVGVY